VNSQRPQTSYGGLSERQKNLQFSLKQISSKLENNKKAEEANNNKKIYNDNFHSLKGTVKQNF
jgi:hypothetical protein